MYRIVNRKKLLLTHIADAISRQVSGMFRHSDTVTEIMPEFVKRILIIRTAYIGDVVMTMPMIKPLKHRFPEARISFLTSRAAAPLLKHHPDIDSVLEFDPFWFYSVNPAGYLKFIRKLIHCRFDLIIEARGDIRDLLFLVFPMKARYKLSYAIGGGSFVLTHVVPHPHINHRVDYHLDIVKFLGGNTDQYHLDWGGYETPEEAHHVRKVFEENNISMPFWCAHPGSRLPLKRWSDDGYAAAFDRIMTKIQQPLVLLGSAQEITEIQRIADRMKHRPHIIAGKIDLRAMSGIIRRASLFVCNDSAPMHIASALKTPTAAIFGPSKSDQTGPWNTTSVVIEKPCACRNQCDEHTCTNTTYQYCMKMITVTDVVDAAIALWKRTGIQKSNEWG